MKIEVVLNGERKELDLRGVKGREIDSFVKTMLQFEKTENMSEPYSDFEKKQKELACSVSGLTLEQLDDLEVDDRAKIYDYITEKVQKSMGFTKLLQK
jgi:protein-arginine kinase activator protein McsA